MFSPVLGLPSSSVAPAGLPATDLLCDLKQIPSPLWASAMNPRKQQEIGRVSSQLGRFESESHSHQLLVWVLVQHHHFGVLWLPICKVGNSNRTHCPERL